MKTCVFLFALAACQAPALAQEFTPPPFEALQRQQQTVEQQRLDMTEKTRIAEQQRHLADQARRDPAAEISIATHAVRQLEIDRERDAIRLQGDLDRMAARNEQLTSTAQLPNRRISRASALIISDPAAYGLPRASSGQYYARLEGHVVLVDAMSELVVRIIDAPASPAFDKPLPPAPPPLPPAPVGR